MTPVKRRTRKRTKKDEANNSPSFQKLEPQMETQKKLNTTPIQNEPFGEQANKANTKYFLLEAWEAQTTARTKNQTHKIENIKMPNLLHEKSKQPSDRKQPTRTRSEASSPDK